MPAGHFVVQLRNGASQRNVPELPVHVVRPRPTRIAQPDAVIFDDPPVLFYDFHAVQDLAGRFLHLAELVHVVPEFRFRNDGIRREDDHPVRLRIRMFLGRRLTADHLILSHHT